MQIFFK